MLLIFIMKDFKSNKYRRCKKLTLEDLLKKAVKLKASDLHLSVGIPPKIRKNKKLISIDRENLTDNDMINYAKVILKDKEEVLNKKDEIDVSYHIKDLGRFRVNIFKTKGSISIAIRIINVKVPTLEELHCPAILKELIKKPFGLVLVTGPTGSGKSTTVSAMINEINMTMEKHIITLEDPIEYFHEHNKSIVHQREIGYDSMSYNSAFRAVLREDPDVIFIGEMRDFQTINIAIQAAETGHLVISTLHTLGASKTIDRIIQVFPSIQQQQIKLQLSEVLEGIISQQLLLGKNNKALVLAMEIMVATPAIRSLIREGKTYQIQSFIETGKKFGMRTMDLSLLDLYNNDIISKESLFQYTTHKENLKRTIIY